MQVTRHDLAHVVSRRRQNHDASGCVRRGEKLFLEQPREIEVSEMVDSDLLFEAIVSVFFIRQGHVPAFNTRKSNLDSVARKSVAKAFTEDKKFNSRAFTTMLCSSMTYDKT